MGTTKEKSLLLKEFKKLLPYETPNEMKLILQKKKSYDTPHMWEEYDKRNRNLLFVSNSKFRKKIATLYNKLDNRRKLVGLIKINTGDFLTFGFINEQNQISVVVYKVEELLEVSVKKYEQIDQHFAVRISLYSKNIGEVVKYQIPVINRAIYLLSCPRYRVIPYSIPWRNYRGLITKYGVINPIMKESEVKIVSTVDDLYDSLKKCTLTDHQLITVCAYVIDEIPVLYVQPLISVIPDIVGFENQLTSIEKNDELTSEEKDNQIANILEQVGDSVEYSNVVFKLLLNQSNMNDDWFISFKHTDPNEFKKYLEERIAAESDDNCLSVLRLFKY